MYKYSRRLIKKIYVLSYYWLQVPWFYINLVSLRKRCSAFRIYEILWCRALDTAPYLFVPSSFWAGALFTPEVESPNFPTVWVSFTLIGALNMFMLCF